MFEYRVPDRRYFIGLQRRYNGLPASHVSTVAVCCFDRVVRDRVVVWVVIVVQSWTCHCAAKPHGRFPSRQGTQPQEEVSAEALLL